MAKIASSDLAKFGMVDETTEGTLETGSPVPVVLTRGITPDYTSNIITDDTVSGAGELLDAQTNLRGLNLTTPARLRFNDARVLIAAALRDVFPAAVSITGSSDIDVVTSGTHLDGSTGTQIQVAEATPALFDDLITYGGVTASTHPRGGAESLLMRLSGFANSENNWHRRIKAVWKDATKSYIDIDDGWIAGDAAVFGEPMVAETGASAVINVGVAIRNRITGSGVKSKTALWQFTDMVNNGKFGGGFGLVAGDYTFGWTGKDGVELGLSWIGHGASVLSATDPTAQGFTDGNSYTEMLTSADALTYMAIVTSSNLMVLSSLNLNGFNFQLAGNLQAVDDISGSTTVDGVVRGTHVPSGTIDYYLVDDPRSEELAKLGDVATAEKGEVSWMHRDGAGNEIACAVLWNEFGQTGPVPGSQNSRVGGSIDFSGHRLTNTSRSFVHQEIAA